MNHKNLPTSARLSLTGRTTAESAHHLEKLSPMRAYDLFRLESPARQGEILELMDLTSAARILRQAKDPANVLEEVSLPRARELGELLEWPDETAASLMSVDYCFLPGDTLVEEIDRTQLMAGAAWSQDHSIYVTWNEDFVGIVTERCLCSASPGATLSSLCKQSSPTIAPKLDQEAVIAAIEDNDYFPLPVVNDGRLIGVVRHVDVAEAAKREATEDAEKQGASAPLDRPYLDTSPWSLWKKRIGWILILFVAESYTSTVLSSFSDELESVVSLAFFVPLLIGTGGNTGTQITTTLTRAMTVDRVGMGDVWRILRKELTTGMLIGLCMSIAGIIRATILGTGLEISLVVALTLVAIVLWSSLVATVLPLVIAKCRLDPAVVSAPFISTLVDGTGLIIYFEIARLILF
ncbi:magnesium transporter [Kocuria massiliensis]|uniref:magnesium transporter n=1 Tax=Kocuria massiliensis TaxID=1926282 RepID=UPI0022B97705|nr:magnesium transporter [Kocuria massiliensis]